MKKIYLSALMISLVLITGCGTANKSTAPLPSVEVKTSSDFIKYNSKLISVEFPKNYEAKENGTMLIVASADGKIIIGGFVPSVGRPQADDGDITFKSVSYSADKMLAPESAVAAALYYRNNDTKTETELREILKTVKRLP